MDLWARHPPQRVGSDGGLTNAGVLIHIAPPICSMLTIALGDPMPIARRLSPALQAIRETLHQEMRGAACSLASVEMKAREPEEGYENQRLSVGFTANWLRNALMSTVEARLHAVAVPDPAKARELFDKLLAEKWPEVSQEVLGSNVYQDRFRPPYNAIGLLLQATSVCLKPRNRNLDETIPPTLRKLDGERPTTSPINSDDFTKILDVLQFPHNHDEWRALVPSSTTIELYDKLKSEIGPSVLSQKSWELPLTYMGLHALPSWPELCRVLEQRSSWAFAFCEAERLYVTGCLAAVHPVSVNHLRVLDRACCLLEGHRPALVLKGVSPKVQDLWVRAWYQLPAQSDGGQGGAAQPELDNQRTIASRMLPLPPTGDEGTVALALCHRFSNAFSEEDAHSIVRALYGEHESSYNLPMDVTEVVAEAVLTYLTTHWVAPAEVLVATSVLAKVGLPWLPPMGCRIALHDPRVSLFILLSACGLDPEENMLVGGQ